MSHIDDDGDVILETLDELRFFAGSTPCDRCRAEARLMLAVLTAPPVATIAVNFSATCEHV